MLWGGGTHRLALQAVKKRDNQLIFVTCADANNVILQESKLTVSLAGGLKIQKQHINKTDNTDKYDVQGNDDSFGNDKNNHQSINNSISASSDSRQNYSNAGAGNNNQSAYNKTDNSSNNSSNNSNSNSNANDGSHSSSQVVQRKRFVAVLSATGVGLACIVVLAVIVAFVGMGTRLTVNGAHTKREK